MEKTQETFIGIDVSKAHLDVHNLPSSEAWQIARTMTALAVDSESIETTRCKKHPQLKNATKAVAREAALWVAEDPEKAWAIFQDLLTEIRRVKYYQPKEHKPPQPRVNKGAANKWQIDRRKKMAVAT